MQSTTSDIPRKPELAEPRLAALTLDPNDAALIARALRLLAKRSVRAQQLLQRLAWRPAA